MDIKQNRFEKLLFKNYIKSFRHTRFKFLLTLID